jgi:Protein of unknown function with HXXEE motif
VLFPGVIWLGLGQVLFGLVGQVIFHGIVTNLKLKSWYNPGLAALMLGHVSLGIWYLADVTGHGLVQWRREGFGSRSRAQAYVNSGSQKPRLSRG